jgi:hypothetical protein
LTENSGSSNSLQEQLLFELLKAIDKIKEEREANNPVMIDSKKTGFESILNSLFDRVEYVIEKLVNIEREINEIQDSLDDVTRGMSFLSYSIKTLYKDCIMKPEL